MKRGTTVMLLAALAAAVMTTAPAGAARRDRTAPQSTWRTPNRAVLASEVSTLRGVSRDASSRIRSVQVRLSGPWVCNDSSSDNGASTSCISAGSNGWHTVNAALSCDRSGRRCSWSAPVPVLLPGEYFVQVAARDAAGNREGACWFGFCYAPQIRILVI